MLDMSLKHRFGRRRRQAAQIAAETAAAAARWQGHTHTWGEDDQDGLRTCAECREQMPGWFIKDGEERSEWPG
jgi:hypothetical protein